MAVTVPTTSALTQTTRTNSTIPLPSGLATGDYTVSVLAFPFNFTAPSAIPTGFTSVYAYNPSQSNVPALYVAYRKWVSGDGNPTWTHVSGVTYGLNIRISGADPTTFLNPGSPSSTGFSVGSTTTHSVSGLTTTSAGAGLLLLLAPTVQTAATYASASSPLTLLLNSANLDVALGTQTSAGASGTQQGNLPSANSGYSAVMLGIKSGAGPDQTLTPSGLDASGSTGAPVVSPDQSLAPAGLNASGGSGDATVQAISIIAVTGLDASGGGGTPLVVLLDQALVAAGLNASGSLGAPVVFTPGPQTLTVPGVNATGGAGAPDFYQPPSALPMLRRCPFCYDGCLTCGFTAWLYF